MFDQFSFGNTGWGDELLSGLGVTVRLAAATLPVGLLIGFGVAQLLMARSFMLRAVGVGYTTLMRGLPEILTLFMVYNGVGLALKSFSQHFAPGGAGFDISPFVAGTTALALVFGAFAAEVIRGGFIAIPRGQIEAGQAIGMSPAQIFWRIKLPQLWRFALPGLGNLWLGLLKDTSLVSIIAVNDLMRMTKVAVGVTKQPFTFYLVACAIYWVLCLFSETALARMERRANRGVARA
ncbi:ABC transporter permease [Kaistia adipata]|uniref:ABC transporter permease n=1 Tax=Kaistia adipata TaxID=166954 RepID=UPI000404E306|nr:ABC transporter permease subunit [Kaistia adipata]